MNVNGVTTQLAHMMVHKQFDLSNLEQKLGGLPDAHHADPTAAFYEKLTKKRTGDVDPNRLVLKPSEVSYEERLKLVISKDDMRNLMHLYSPYKMRARGEAEGVSLMGRVVDRRI